MTEQTARISTRNIDIVDNFLNALAEENFDAAEALLDENFAWQNVGFPTISGRNRVMGMFRKGQGKFVFDVKIHRSGQDGNSVLNERTDALTFGPLRVQFWVCGVFEVHDGRITLWRDYFDNGTFLKGLVRGLVGIAVPSVRARM